jgi:predicted nucleic acid-binding protein
MRRFTALVADGWSISDQGPMPCSRLGPVLYEFTRVTTHPCVMRRPWSASATWQFVAALLASPGGLAVLIPTQRHGDEAAEVIAELPHLAGHLMHDAHTATLMREHGIALICTWGTDFSRFPFVEVIDPLGSSQATD